jgi:hypothetical protein
VEVEVEVEKKGGAMPLLQHLLSLQPPQNSYFLLLPILAAFQKSPRNLRSRDLSDILLTRRSEKNWRKKV